MKRAQSIIAAASALATASILNAASITDAFCIVDLPSRSSPSSSRPSAQSPPPSSSPSSLQSSPLGDIFSGITGQAPKSLQYPPDVLTGTNIDPDRPNVDVQRVYKASQDGWSAVNFHDCVDGRGSALVVALSRSGKKFGGFNPLGWMSTDDYGSSNAAFLWFESGAKAVRCPVLSGGNAGE